METDTPARISVAQAREAIINLAAHPAGGYEWECNGCFDLFHPRDLPGLTSEERDQILARCPHQRQDDAAISRLDVLAILDRVGA